jgi:hypothetical protein
MVEVNKDKLAEQLDAAQSILEDIRITSGCKPAAALDHRPSPRNETTLETARRLYKARQLRTDFVGEKDLFGEPAWDILLDLFIRQAGAEPFSVEDAVINANTSRATGLRWVQALMHHGLVAIAPAAIDTDQQLVQLTPAGFEGMSRYLESVAARDA